MPKQHARSQHARGSQVAVDLLRHDVAFVVLHLDHVLRKQFLFLLVLLDLAPQLLSLLYACDLSEEGSVGDAETLKTVDMARLVKVLVECAPAHVYEVSANLAGEFDAQAVKLVQPEGDGLAVPGEW